MAWRVTACGRRAWLGLCLAAVGGCSAATARPKARAQRAQRAKRAKRAKGPQTMTGLLVDGYMADLREADPQKRITAARELGALGSAARKAVPALENLTADANQEVRDAAARAIAEIRR